MTEDSVMSNLCKWRIDDKVKCMCFDIVAVNTKEKGGTCILLEEKHVRELLAMACLHHIQKLF